MVFKVSRPLAAMLALAGCTMGPDFQQPDWVRPSSWLSGPREAVQAAPSLPVPEPVDPEWWRLFNDDKLTALERRVAAENLDVQIAAVRVAESRDQLGVARAAELPSLNGNTSYVRQQASNHGIFVVIPTAAGASGASGATVGGVQSHGLHPFDIWQGGLDASWEVDLWGRVRRSVEAASATVESSQDAQRGALVSTLAEVARDYIQLRGAQARLQIARDNVKSARQSLDLTRQRAEGGVTTDLDVANASAQLRTILSEIPAFEQQEAAMINALSLLVGQPPNALREELAVPRPVPPVPPSVPVGLPSELARRRPDIRVTEAQLHIATADIGVAEANFYPTLMLNGSGGLQSLQLNHAFDLSARQYAIGPSLSIPIFQGGQLIATLELKKDQQKEAALVFQKTVLQAWHEIDNALTAYQAEQIRRDELMRAVADNTRALALAQSRYQQGVADFLSVLDSQRSLLSTQQQLADSTTIVSADLVSLYKALGGGWESDLPESRTVLAR